MARAVGEIWADSAHNPPRSTVKSDYVTIADRPPAR